jgi:ABC-type methionine transport system permease subunit
VLIEAVVALIVIVQVVQSLGDEIVRRMGHLRG